MSKEFYSINTTYKYVCDISYFIMLYEMIIIDKNTDLKIIAQKVCNGKTGQVDATKNKNIILYLLNKYIFYLQKIFSFKHGKKQF